MSAKNYKVGDKVMVRADFAPRRGGYSIGVNSNMYTMKGNILTITEIVSDAYYNVRENQWAWADDMLVDIIQPCKPFREENIDSREIGSIDIELLKDLFSGA